MLEPRHGVDVSLTCQPDWQGGYAGFAGFTAGLPYALEPHRELLPPSVTPGFDPVR